ncbi:hypothetical protein [Avibacterium endocarditidis]|nr:hypothetical protein [Avibacterium endocarditidis]
MIPIDPIAWQASGHVTLWHNGNAIGNHHYILNQAGQPLAKNYFWELK